MLKQNIIGTIGNTPLVRLNRIYSNQLVNIYAKLEYFNPGGSVKDRTALYMINEAEKEGKLKEGSTIIEPTAGNTGIGLALVASQKGYKTIFVVPERFSLEKQVLMKALGAEIINTPTGEGMEGAIKKATEINKNIENSIILQQFSNPSNTKAHYEMTAPEIYNDLEGKIDVFVAGIGTGGTFMGISKYLKEKIPNLYSVAVEPQGSILGKKEKGRHKIEGIGVDDLETTKLIDFSLIDEVFTVKDEDAHRTLKELAKLEGILAGSSSGAACFAAIEIAKRFKTANIVTLFPDSSERYLTKNIYGALEEWRY